MKKSTPKNFTSKLTSTSNLADFSSLMDMFHLSITRYKNKIAYTCNGNSLTFNEVDRYSRDFAAYLQSKFDITKGCRIGLMCPNNLAFPVAMWGIIRAGAVQVNINPNYTASELKHQLNDAQINTIVIVSSSIDVLVDIQAQTSIKNVIIISEDDIKVDSQCLNNASNSLHGTIDFIEMIKQGFKLPFTEPSLSSKDLVFLQYTGGTTGLSKGAMLTHVNIIANILQYGEFNQQRIVFENEVVLTAIPMYHIFALTVNTLCYFFYGAQNILVINPRNTEDFIQAWQAHSITFFTGVNTLFNGLLHLDTFKSVDFSSLKLTIGGGAPVQESVAQKWLEVTGNILNEGYGLSETSPVLTLNIQNEGFGISGIGKPLPLTELSIRNNEGIVIEQGKTGELCAKGPQVMLGYWQQPYATQEVMTKDDYFKTGDIAFLDDRGFYHIVDRKKDMILVSGFNVYPNEIEAVIGGHPDVFESACVGIPDEKTGEAVQIFIVKETETLTKESVIDFCQNKLSSYKRPKQIHFVNELPKSPVGKLLRRELRDNNKND
jgi:long-chain acyl-CoA synthetase